MLNYDKFLYWAEDRFGSVKSNGKEIKINSMFSDEPDYKYHLWCCPSGGKNEREYGVYHCWKTDQKGTLIGLVMKVDKCSFEEALETLDAGDTSLAEMEKKLDEFFYGVETFPEVAPLETIQKQGGLPLPEGTFLIDSLEESDFYRIEAESHLSNRKIPTKGLYVCISGEYQNRIIIPYYDKDGRIIYYNSRYLGSEKDIPKYLGPPIQCGIGKSDVVFMTKWPELGSMVFFTEGEFDAKAIELSGLNSGAFGGKSLSEIQANLISGYVPVICLDADAAGKKALLIIGDLLKSSPNMFKKVFYVVPPDNFKDWNKMFEKRGPKMLKAYLLSAIQEYTIDTSMLLKGNL